MRIENIGTVIAERELDGYDDGAPCKVFVRFGQPFQNESGDSWYCPYSISSPQGERIFYGAGVDSLQALRIAIANVSAELATRYAGFRLKWLNENDLGFSS
jgi:hypothetical protein